MSKYKEIFKLKKMLEDAHIPFDWEESFGYGEHDLEKLKRIAPDLIEHYHIMYPHRGDLQICSVIEGFGTYGESNDLLEIMGLLTPEEGDDDCVVGYLTAEEVFKRIENHYRKELIFMKKTVKVIDEDTLEIIDVVEEETTPTEDKAEELRGIFTQALDCEPEEFYQRYRSWKKAEADFKEVFEPFKAKLLELHKTSVLPKSVVIGGVKVTYVEPSVRTSIDSKKLKEEEPEIAKKFTKTTNVSATIRTEEI